MVKNTEVVSTEYAVEVNNEYGFVRRINEWPTYEAAERFLETYDGELNSDEWLNIIFIDYNENGDEVQFGTVC